MNRRTMIRTGTLFAIGMALGKMDSLSAAGGQLTCDLSQWSHVVFKYKGKTVTVPVSEVFAAVSSVGGAHESTPTQTSQTTPKNRTPAGTAAARKQ